LYCPLLAFDEIVVFYTHFFQNFGGPLYWIQMVMPQNQKSRMWKFDNGFRLLIWSVISAMALIYEHSLTELRAYLMKN
jgi:hypothetical protein